MRLARIVHAARRRPGGGSVDAAREAWREVEAIRARGGDAVAELVEVLAEATAAIDVLEDMIPEDHARATPALRALYET